MELISALTALCGEGLRGLSSLPASLPLSLFLAGLAGSLVHCVGMCGPFVLTQVMADAGRSQPGGYGEWHRLGGAALPPSRTITGPPPDTGTGARLDRGRR